MTGRQAPSRLEKTILLVVSALLASSPFVRTSAAQEMRVERVGFSAPIGGAAIAAPRAALSVSGILPSFAPALLPAPFDPASANAAAPSAAQPAAVPAEAAARQAIAAAGASSAKAVAAQPASAPDAAGKGGEAQAGHRGTAVAAALESVRSLSPVPESAAGIESPRSSEMEREGAERDFAELTGERLASHGADASAPAAGSFSAGAPRLSGRARGARRLAALPAVLAAGLPSLHLSVSSWHALSQAGYVTGNVGAAIFPLVQIYETFHGKSTPKIRAIVGAAASLALGLISAPILHKSLWGVQNIFGGITLLIPLFLGALKGRVKGSGLKETALISAAAAAVSAGIYFTVAAVLPQALAAVLSAAAIARVALVVQFATSAMFLWMFLPDVVKVLRGKAAGGFSPGFNLMFFLSALGSMVWAIPAAWIYSGADQGTYRLIFAVNAIYAFMSFLSFWFARREAKPD